MKRLTTLVLIVALLLQLHPVVFADDSDIFGYNIQPNVMILIDSSQSMSDSVDSGPYAPGTTYAPVKKCDTKKDQTCYQDVVYQSGSSSTYTLFASTVSAVNSSTAQSALNTVGYWAGPVNGSQVSLSTGNYLNYRLGACPTTPCKEPKITIAKRVVSNLISSVDGVRFGTMKFKSGGGEIMSPVGTDTATLLTGITNMTQTSVGTVLGEAMQTADQYYSGTGYTSPIQLACQPNFLIVITDGLYTGIDPAPVATALYNNDHSALKGKQNVIVDTIGFGIGVSESGNVVAANKALLQTATNGGGQFYDTNNSTDLEAALQDAIHRITAATFTFATPVLPTTSTTGSSRAYLAAFKSDPVRSFWQGFLKAYQRDSSGMVPVDSTGVPLDSAKIWDSGALLSTTPSANRSIWTTITQTKKTWEPFTNANNTIKAKVLGVTGKATADQVISYIRGVDAFDENGNLNVTEDRAWKLGDIFHSTPVLVTPPLMALYDSSYATFKNNNVNRTKVLIAGSNDGMLHAFKESDGTELWAYIPEELLDDLQTATVTFGTHPYFVDGSPIAADIKTADGTWHTIVVFGLRRGGASYYALDITDTTSPMYMWTFTDSKIAETWSEPAIGKVRIGSSEKFVAFVGGGYNTPANNASGKAFFVIDLETGNKLWEYYNDGTTLDDRQYMNFSLPANPAAVDVNNDGFIDRVYIGDVGGQMWKFDVSATATASWTGKRLFAAPLASGTTNPPGAGEYYPAQGIYGAPTLALDKDLKLWLFFGTGDRNHPNSTTAPNRFYGIKDTTNMTNGATLTETDLADVTGANATAASGWFFRLGPGEKVLAAGNVFNMIAYFSTFTPTSTATCETGFGTAKLYGVQAQTGYAAVDFTTGVALVSTDATKTRSKTIGGGIASMPVIVITPPATATSKPLSSAVVGTTNQEVLGNLIPAPAVMKQVRWWRELAQ